MSHLFLWQIFFKFMEKEPDTKFGAVAISLKTTS